MKLYYSPGSCSTAPRILLAEAGIACEQEAVNLKTHETAAGSDFYKVNPNGYVPALVLDDGTLLTEGAAINQYIADLVPQKKLAPENGTVARYQLQGWLNFIATELHKSYSVLFNRNSAEDWKADARAKLAKRYEYVDAALAKHAYLMGENFTAADAYLFVVLGWSNFCAVDLSAFANIDAFIKRVAARPSVQSVKAADAK